MPTSIYTVAKEMLTRTLLPKITMTLFPLNYTTATSTCIHAPASASAPTSNLFPMIIVHLSNVLDIGPGKELQKEWKKKKEMIPPSIISFFSFTFFDQVAISIHGILSFFSLYDPFSFSLSLSLAASKLIFCVDVRGAVRSPYTQLGRMLPMLSYYAIS